MKLYKVFTIIIVSILCICFIIGCFTIYKFLVLQKIFQKMEDYVAKENYYMKMTDASTGKIINEIYYKNGIGKMLTSNGVYTWTDGNEAFLVIDETKKIQKLNMQSLGLISNEAVASMIPGYAKNKLERLLLAGNITTSISIKHHQDFKYYKIVATDTHDGTRNVWVNYHTGIPIQSTIKIDDIEKTYLYEITFDSVKDEQIRKPNIEEYTWIDSEE